MSSGQDVAGSLNALQLWLSAQDWAPQKFIMHVGPMSLYPFLEDYWHVKVVGGAGVISSVMWSLIEAYALLNNLSPMLGREHQLNSANHTLERRPERKRGLEKDEESESGDGSGMRENDRNSLYRCMKNKTKSIGFESDSIIQS